MTEGNDGGAGGGGGEGRGASPWTRAAAALALAASATGCSFFVDTDIPSPGGAEADATDDATDATPDIDGEDAATDADATDPDDADADTDASSDDATPDTPFVCEGPPCPQELSCGGAPRAETFVLTFSTLTAHNPACVDNTSPAAPCLDAARRYCEDEATACFTTGVGVLQDEDGGEVRVECLALPLTRYRVSAQDLGVSDEGAAGRPGQQAAARYCERQGFGAGIGPTAAPDGLLAVDCMSAERADVVFNVDAGSLMRYGCEVIAEQERPWCTHAMTRVCADRGFTTGLGPYPRTGQRYSGMCVHAP